MNTYPLHEAARLAGVSATSLRRWLYAGVFGRPMRRTGSGHRVVVPADVVPIAATLAEFQAAAGGRVPYPVLRAIVDVYDDGRLAVGSMLLTWTPRIAVGCELTEAGEVSR